MITKSFRLEDLERVKICLGYVGENEHTQVRIDCASAFAEYPGATPALAVKPPRGGIYPAVIETDGNTVVWTVTNSDLLFKGDGEIQFSFSLGDVIKKTAVGKFTVKRSIITSANVPDPVAEWLIRATAAAAAAEAAAQHQPKIENEYWYVWDADAEDYVSTGIKAKGDKGDPGTPGDPTQLIDDETPASNKTFSSSKVDQELTGVKSALDGKINEPSSEGTSGQVLATNGNGGRTWVTPTGSGVVIDTTLSVSGAAADSKAVGDAFKPYSDELKMQTITVDLLEKAIHTEGRKIDPDGAIQNVSTFDIYEIEYDGTYSTFDAVLYSSSNYLLRAMTFHDENGTALETDEFLNTTGDYKSTFTNKSIPAGTKKIYLSYRNTMGPCSATCTIKKSKRLSDIEGDIDSLSVFPMSSKNLCDESDKFVGLIYETNGVLYNEYTTHRATNYIEIEPNTIYTISAKGKNTGKFNIEGLRYAFYTSDKTFISGFKPEGAWSTFRTPSTAKYIRFSMLQTNNEKWQLERRQFATKYVPFNTIAYNDESDEMFMNFPSKSFAVTGLEYNWYLFNVRPDRYENEFASRYYMPTITSMARFGRFLRMKSNNTSTTTRVIGAEAKSLTKYGYKLFNIIVKNPANLQNVSVLVLGDSTTANGYVVQYLHEFAGSENKITTLGSLGTAPYNHEGRSGWRLYDYFHTSSNNPFYNPSTQTFDAAYYFTNSGVSQPDIFIVNLGINDMHYDSSNLYDAKIHAAEFIEMMNTVIESVKGVNSSIKVAICLATPPNTNPEAFGTSGVNICDYDEYRIANLVLCEALIDEYDYRESEGIYLIPINACLDTKYNMPTETGYPNSRSTQQITIPTNAANVHPNSAGYHQIADEMYAFICSLYVT